MVAKLHNKDLELQAKQNTVAAEDNQSGSKALCMCLKHWF